MDPIFSLNVSSNGPKILQYLATLSYLVYPHRRAHGTGVRWLLTSNLLYFPPELLHLHPRSCCGKCCLPLASPQVTLMQYADTFSFFVTLLLFTTIQMLSLSLMSSATTSWVEHHNECPLELQFKWSFENISQSQKSHGKYVVCRHKIGMPVQRS